MLSWILRRKLAAFEKENDYDMSYARELLDLGPGVLLRFHRATRLNEYRANLPLGAWFAAAILSVRAGDCGTCTQLMVNRARRAGVPGAHLQALLSGRFSELPADTRLCAEYACAVLERTPTEEMRERVVKQFGKHGLVALAFAVAAGGLYPTIKYALGYGEACARIQVDGEAVNAALIAKPAA